MKKYSSFRPISGSISALLDPLLAKRTHVDAALALSWPDLAGEKLAGRTQPLKVVWPRRNSPDDPFEPGVLTVACEGAVALDLQYQTSQLISRINGFFGYSAISRIRIEQRAIDGFRPKKTKQIPQLKAEEQVAISGTVKDIEDAGLREALIRLGTSVKAERNTR